MLNLMFSLNVFPVNFVKEKGKKSDVALKKNLTI